jgi:hypothetical protein
MLTMTIMCYLAAGPWIVSLAVAGLVLAEYGRVAR